MNGVMLDAMLKRRLRAAFTIGCAVLSFIFISCGHKGTVGSGLAPTGRVGAHRDALAAGGSRTAPTMPLADILAQIDAYQPPKSVDAARFAALKAELKRLLTERAAGTKSISLAPTALMDKVTDLRVSSNQAGTQATLTWTEVLPGDYNNDGVVDISDLQPVALYYGQRTDTGPDDPHKLVEGDDDPEINVGDIQAVSANYASRIQGYRIYRGTHPVVTTIWEKDYKPNAGDPAATDWSVDRPATPPISTRPKYTYIDDISALADKDHVRYKVIPFGDGAEGTASAEGSMAPPAYWQVTGRIADAGGAAIKGVQVTATPAGLSGLTAADGSYVIGGLQNGTYTMTPSKLSYTFEAASAEVTISSADAPGVSFVATAHPYDISGTVRHPSGVGAAGTTVTLSPGGQTFTVASDGGFVFSGTFEGQYTLTPAKDGFTFTPPSVTVTAAGTPLPGNDFTAYPTTAPWPMEGRDARGTNLSPYVGPSGNAALWSYPAKDAGGKIRIGTDGTIFLPTQHDGVLAVNPDGTSKWRFVLPTLGFPGDEVNGCVILPDGTIWVTYIIDDLSNSPPSYICALSPADGSVIWVKLWVKSWGYGSLTVAPDGTVYGAARGVGVCALSPLDGSVKWTRSDLFASNRVTAGPDGKVFLLHLRAGNDYVLYALNPGDGSTAWSFDFGTDYVNPGNDALIGVDGTVYYASRKYLYGFNSSDGSIRWKTQPPLDSLAGIFEGAVGPDGMLYYPYGQAICVIGPADGSLRAQIPTGGTVGAAPIIDSAGTMYFQADTLTAMRPDGTFVWTAVSPISSVQRPVGQLFIGAIGADGLVYAYDSENGYLCALGGSGQPTFNVRGQVTDSSTYNPDRGLYGCALFLWPGFSTFTGYDYYADWLGGYYISNVPPGTYTLTPKMPGYAFDPPSRQVVVTDHGVTGQDFIGTPTYHVSGTVTGPSSAPFPLAGVNIGLAPDSKYLPYFSALSSPDDGKFDITNVAPGTYTLTPLLDGYTFDPPTRQVIVDGRLNVGEDFVGTPTG